MSRKSRNLGWFIFTFHLIGALATIVPQTRGYVLSYTPYYLVFLVIVLAAGHQNNRTGFARFFLITFLAGYLIELLGVNTGFPFGEYTFGNTLGVKFLDVPIAIGLSWFMLSYVFGMLYNDFRIPVPFKIILASFSMVILDMLIEPVAISLDYWQWEEENIPFKNYAGMFLVGLGMQFCFTNLLKSKTNLWIIPIIVSQIIYFTLVFIFAEV